VPDEAIDLQVGEDRTEDGGRRRNLLRTQDAHRALARGTENRHRPLARGHQSLRRPGTVDEVGALEQLDVASEGIARHGTRYARCRRSGRLCRLRPAPRRHEDRKRDHGEP